MAIPKITRKEEQVLLLTGLLDFPLSPLTLQETALLDRPSSPSDCLISACKNLSLAPFTSPSSLKPALLPSVPTDPSDKLGSDAPPSLEVPETIAPKLLAQVNPYWESLPKVKEVTAPAVIEFKTFEKEELDPSTGKIVHTRVIYPVITPRDKESPCISVPSLSAAEGQVNSLTPCPSAMKSECVDGNLSTTTTPRDLPTPRADQVEPAPDILTRDVIASDGVVSPLHQMPTSPRQTPLPEPHVPLVSSSMRSAPGSPRMETPPLLQWQAESPKPAQQPPAFLRRSPGVLLPTSSPCSLSGEGFEDEEGQFDDAEESENGDSPMLHPSEQLLPPSLSPSPTPSPIPSQVHQMVQRILGTTCPTPGPSTQDTSPDIVDVAVSPSGAPLCPKKQGSNDTTPMDMSTQGDSLNALDSSPDNNQSVELPLLKYISLPPNAGRGTLIKQLFAPRGAFAAPRMVCPPSVSRESVEACAVSRPLTLPLLLSQSHIQPMTMELGHLPSPLPVNTPVQAALDQVTSPRLRPSVFADQPIPKELTLPKPYSVPLPLPRTSPVMPVLDEVPTESMPLPMDSENDLPLNSIPVAELLNTCLPEDASLMPIIISGPGLKKSGTAMKLIVSAPKMP